MERKNKNRGYQQLRVWQDAITLYVETCQLFKSWPFEMKRIAGQAFRMETSLLPLIESLERKRDSRGK